MKLGRMLIFGLLVIATIAYATTSAAAPPSWKVERYYTTETWHAFADIGAKKASPDDLYAAQRSLKTPDGRSAGVVNGYGVNLHPPYVFFHWTATLAGGTLTLESAVSLKDKVATYPIAGGTGRYAGVRGTVTLTEAGDKGTLATVRYTR